MNRNTASKLLKYVMKYKLLTASSLLFSVVSVISALYLPILNGRAIDCIISAGSVDFAKILPILYRAGAMVFVGAAAQWIMTLSNNRLCFSVVRDLRRDATSVIQKLPLSYIDNHPTGDTVSRIITDAEQVGDGLLLGFSQTFTGIITILSTLIFMFRLNVLVALIVVLVTPLSLFVASFIARKTHRYFKEQSDIRGMQTGLIGEVIGNQKTVQAFDMEDHYRNEFEEKNTALENASLKATFYSSLVNPCTRFVNSCVYAGVACFGALNVISGGMTVGGLTIFLSYAGQYTKPFNEISSVLTEMQNAFVCARRLFEMIESEQYDESEIFGDKNAVETTPDTLEENVSFEDVSFSYSKDKPLIENLTLDITNGMHVAIVGPTGCGKTTLINLLMRFYDVNSGRITIGQNYIRDLSFHELRKKYGMVLQDTWIKTGTVRDNICIGKPDATDEEIEAAARASHAYSFIKRLPSGFDTMLGEGGAVLSAGEAQLLCICRVMIAVPSILILDEATSSIDTRTEQRIQRAFGKLTKGRTSFIIAHRLSTIKNSDMILVMKDGHIIEHGGHDDLMAAGGFYHELYTSQFAAG